MSDTFTAFLAEKDDDGFRRGLRQLEVDDLHAGDVVIDVEWSSVNYKDHLASIEKGRVARTSPLVPGIDLAGTVRSSGAPEFSPGDRVIAGDAELGVSHHGGYSQVARVPADFVVPLPDGLTTREAMLVGTGGFTAAMSVLALLDHGVTPDSGTILVTGATGGVGSMAVAMLAKLGFTVAASTGKPEAEPYLRGLGASEIIDRAEWRAPSGRCSRPAGRRRSMRSAATRSPPSSPRSRRTARSRRAATSADSTCTPR